MEDQTPEPPRGFRGILRADFDLPVWLFLIAPLVIAAVVF